MVNECSLLSVFYFGPFATFDARTLVQKVFVIKACNSFDFSQMQINVLQGLIGMFLTLLYCAETKLEGIVL